MTWRRPLILSVLLAGAAGAFAQTPAGFPQLDVATSPGAQALAGATLDGRGNVTLLWTQLFADGGIEERARWRRFGPFGPLAPDAVLTNERSTGREVVSNRRGDVVAIWYEFLGRPQGALRRISQVHPAVDLRFNYFLDDVDISASGSFVVTWTAATPAGNRVMYQVFDSATGRPGPQFTVSAAPSPGGESGGAVAVGPRGDSVVVWTERNDDNSTRGIFGRRADFSGPLGSEFQVNTTPIGVPTRFAYEVGKANDGSFVVAWSHRESSELSTGIFAQRFNAAGEKAGGEILIAEDAPPDGYVRLAVAPEGHFAVAWDDGAPPLFVRLYRKDGTPVSPARELVERTTPFPGVPELDFGYNGTFVLAWNNFIGLHDPEGDNAEVNYQLFAASPGTEICLFRNGHFRCDTDGGGGFEIDHVFAVRRGTPLLGDVDGDGRDDYCMFRGTRFDCDSGHDYGAAETVIAFGQHGDTPLLGDVDADGRDEACVFRTGRFLCDTGHDGGAAETTIVFGGLAVDRALLGDVDGDGRDEACVFRVDGFLCDTGHNGGTAETVIATGTLGLNVPLLGDINSDGRDDACFFGLFGAGVFTCNIGDEGIQVLVTGVGRPLIGNVDGL